MHQSQQDTPLQHSTRLARLVPWAVGTLTIGLFYGALAWPGNALIARDLPFLHLPLRTAFVRLAAEGLPLWNPFLHGGQPILSNPHYAAFYPPTWLHLIVDLPFSLNLIILLHALVGFAGAWSAVRAFGGARDSAALGAIAFSGGALFVLPSVLNLFCGVAWLPWTLVWSLRFAKARASRHGSKSLIGLRLLCAGGIVLPLLAGSPAAALFGAVSFAVIMLYHRPALEALKQVAAIGILAALLGAAQWLPTAGRLAGSTRHGGLDSSEAGEWSSSPVRLVELLVPHFAGDPGRDEEQLYFGWRLHDKNYPLVLSIYPGVLMTLLAVPMIFSGRSRSRWALATLVAVAIFLALGRYNPLFATLRPLVPLLRSLRYPEKFLCLLSLAWVTLAALGWHDLFERPRRSFERLALVTTVLAAAAAVAAWARPDWVEALLLATGGPTPEAVTAAGVDYFRRQILVLVSLSGAVLALFRACRLAPDKRLLWSVLAGVLLALDLWSAGRHLNPVGPAEWLSEPPDPPHAELPAGGRLLSTLAFDQQPETGMALGRPGLRQMRTKLDRLDPYSGLLWGESYVLHEDYDLLLTAWGQHALALFASRWSEPRARDHIAAAWSANSAVVRRPPRELFEEYQATGRRPYPARLLPIAESLPIYRIVERVHFVPDLEQGFRALAATDFDVSRQEVVLASGPATEKLYDVGRPAPGAKVTGGPGTRIRESERSRPAHLVLDYATPSDVFAIAAITYDSGWAASRSGQPLEVYPTALGQLGFELPPGSGEVELIYSDRRVEIGLAISLITLLVSLFRVSRGATSASARARRAEAQ